MKRVFKMFMVLSLMIIGVGCFNKSESTNEEKNVISTTRNGEIKPFFRGTPNSWGKDEMYKIDDNVWSVVTYFQNGGRFKVDMYGDWSVSYPNNDYVVNDTISRPYKVTFNEITKEIDAKLVYTTISLTTSEAVIESGDTSFTLPTDVIARQSGHTNMVKIEKWYPALNVNKLGTTVYTAHYADTFTTFKLTVNQKSETKMVLSSDNQTIKKGDTTFKLPEQAVIVSSNYRNVTVNVTWTPALDVNKVGTTVYTAKWYSGPQTAQFTLTVTEGYLSNNEKMYFRGTPNAWGATPMNLVDDNIWEIEQEFNANEKFKVTVDEGWTKAYPNVDYPIYEKGKYRIRFYENGEYLSVDKMEKRFNVYPIEAKIVEGEQYTLPEYASYYENGDYSTIENLTWTPSLNVNKVGETVYTTEYNGIKAEFKLTVTAKGDVGTVKLNAVAEGVSNGKLVEYAFNYAGVYLDGNSFYGGPGANYTINENGYVEFQIESGNHTVSVGKMTGSHWYSVSEIVNFEVNAGTSKEIKIVIPPSGAKIYANGNAGAGKAYYVTGQTKYLGEWATAYKMTYNNQTGKWETAKLFPIGAEFKIVRAAYTDADTISTKNVEWEKGSNHIITNTYAYGESINEFSPIF